MSPPPADRSDAGIPQPGSDTGIGGQSAPEDEIMDWAGADMSAPDRDEDLGVGIMGAETEKTKTPEKPE